jgi:protein O-GlcNAc transferase
VLSIKALKRSLLPRYNPACAGEQNDMSRQIVDAAAASLGRAIELHRKGHLALAEQEYVAAFKAAPRSYDAASHLAAFYVGIGNPALAARFFGKAAALEPTSADAAYNYGYALQMAGRFDEALRPISTALKLQPRMIEALTTRGSILRELKRYDEALRSFDEAIRIDANFSLAWNNRGNTLRLAGRPEEAVQSLDRALEIEPGSAFTHYNRGLALVQMKDSEGAVQAFDSAVKLAPQFAEAHCGRGVALGGLERYTDALASHDRALALKPDYAEALLNRGITLVLMKRSEEAIACLDQAIAAYPNYAEAWFNRAAAFAQKNMQREALKNIGMATKLRPDYADAHQAGGSALTALAMFEDAVKAFNRVLAITPENADAYMQRGIALGFLKKFEQAIADFVRARAIQQDTGYLLSSLIHARLMVCDWSTYDADNADLQALMALDVKAAIPMQLISMPSTSAQQKLAAEKWIALEARVIPAGLRKAKRSAQDKIRIGYFSPDFCIHPVAILTAELFEMHDRSQFDIIAFSSFRSDDAMQQRLKLAFDEFIDITDVADSDVVALARSKNIDIAVDLAGFTQGSRPSIFGMRAAPVQVNFLGYPGTMGAPFMDYIIGDPVVIPSDSRQYYSEKIVSLPDTYLPNDSKRPISGNAFARRDFGLPETGFVFCSFNASYKITPDVFSCWMLLLDRVPGSVLWLSAHVPATENNLRKEATARGIDPARLIFATRTPGLAEHLARHKLADLFLDTLPFNAHTTAADALWAGLPVLTHCGETFAGRVAASLLNAIGLPELIAENPAAYEALALELATDPGRLSAIRSKLAANRLSSPLFDTARYTRHIEAAFAEMHRRYLAGLDPEHIEIQCELKPAPGA